MFGLCTSVLYRSGSLTGAASTGSHAPVLASAGGSSETEGARTLARTERTCAGNSGWLRMGAISARRG